MDQLLEMNEWLQQRCGRFTSSEIHKLFTGGRRDMTDEELKAEKLAGGKRRTVDMMFGDTALSYIYKKIAERLTLSVKEESNFIQTNWGKEWEWNAYEAYEEVTGQKGDYYGVNNPKFFEYGDYGGCSPDYLYNKKGADFKNPFNSSEHLINLKLKTQDDFKDKRWEYYCQAQCIIYKLNLEEFDFVSHDKRFIEPKYRLKIINVKPDKEWQKEFELRFNAAIQMTEDIIKSL
jgi:hypothetical protein